MNTKIKKFIRICWLLAMVLINAAVWGAEEKAEFSIHLFQNGLPIADAELSISSESFDKSSAILIFEATPAMYTWRPGSDAPLKTNASGSLAGKLPPGFYQFTVKTKKQEFTFDLPLHSAENAQILVTFYSGKKPPLLNIESSVAGTMAGSEMAGEAKRDQGEGTIIVKVLSAETQKPVKDVQVFLSGLKEKFRTDEQGRISATVPVGSYSVSLLHSAYSSQTLDDVKIAKDQDTPVNFKLTPAGVELAEYVVLEPHLAGTIASVIEEQRRATSVATVMGAEQFSRNGDSDVARALTRASGLTLVGGQFIFIRGLGERYASTLINGAAIPSPDPTRRVVPMDLFPTTILESVMVQKSYSPDRPGEFAGGTLEMRTRGIPDAFFFNLNLQTGFNTNATFQKALTYKGGGTDFLSFDDGARAMPDSLAEATKDGKSLTAASPFNPGGVTPVQFEKLGEDLSGVWDVTRKTRGPDGVVQASMGDSFTLGDFRVGYIGATGWRQEFRTQNEINREYANTNSGNLRNIQDFNVHRSLREVQLNGYFATEAHYKDNHKLFARTMFLRQSFDEGRISQGFTDTETYSIRRTKLRFYSNQLWMNQVGGEHRFDWLKDLSVNWLYTDSIANRGEPKTRDYRFDDLESNNIYSLSRKGDNNQVSFQKLVDKDKSWRVDAKLPVPVSPHYKLILGGGFIAQEKTRQSGIRRFNYFPVGADATNQAILEQPSLESIFQPAYIGTNGFQLREVTRSTDSYGASQSLFSHYGKVDLTLYDKLNITGGVRWENNDQLVETFQSVAHINKPVTSRLNRINMLPSVTATLFLTDKQQLRAGYSQTLSRPDFRELSPAPFTDINTNLETSGNPNLQQTSITNYDVRWEYYLSPTENIFAGFFWKDLIKPIELISQPGTAGLNTYQNADKANIFGFEIEILKGLGFVHHHLQNFVIGGNYTWSSSNVQFNTDNLVVQTTNNRQLQGHSAQILNLQLGYDNPTTKTQATLLYNVASQRIAAAGTLGIPDKYEHPFNQLDFVFSQNLYKGVSMQFNAQNLMDDDFLVTQGNQISRQFRRGRLFNLSVRLAY